MANFWYAFAPHKNVFELTKPGAISDNISMPKPVIATISNFLHSERGYNFSEEQIRNFNSLPTV